jgi:hypothetical protein
MTCGAPPLDIADCRVVDWCILKDQFDLAPLIGRQAYIAPLRAAMSAWVDNEPAARDVQSIRARWQEAGQRA